jgi:HlyD family secretion protein
MVTSNGLFRSKALERLRSPEQLNHLLSVTQPRDWLPLACVVLVLAALAAWAVLARIDVIVKASGAFVSQSRAEAVVFVKLADSADLQDGMTVRVVQRARRSNRPIAATITGIGEELADLTSVEHVTRNATLARDILSRGELVPVTIALDASAQGLGNDPSPRSTALRGAIVDVEIVTASPRPIELLLPGLGR